MNLLKLANTVSTQLFAWAIPFVVRIPVPAQGVQLPKMVNVEGRNHA